MFKRPSSRRKTAQQEVVLNLVPILDTMVTLIAFLLYSISFLSLVSIESTYPQVSTEDVREKLKEKPLQLTLTLRDGGAEIWSPFEKIAPKKVANITDGEFDLAGIHSALLEVKQKFPNETKIVIVPHAGVSYDMLISVMDSVRNIEASDPPLYARNEQTGVDEAVKTLFPEVIFGNLLGDS